MIGSCQGSEDPPEHHPRAPTEESDTPTLPHLPPLLLIRPDGGRVNDSACRQTRVSLVVWRRRPRAGGRQTPTPVGFLSTAVTADARSRLSISHPGVITKVKRPTVSSEWSATHPQGFLSPGMANYSSYNISWGGRGARARRAS